MHLNEVILAFSLAAMPAGDSISSPLDSADLADLVRLEAVWNEAHVNGDANTLDSLWADELIVTVPRMKPFSKPEALRVVRSGRVTFERYHTSDLRMSIHGNAAIVMGRLERRRKMKDRDIFEDWQFTKVYMRRGGKWQVFAWHASERALK